MILGQVFERFVTESPVSVMVRGLLEKILSSQKLDELFEPTFGSPIDKVQKKYEIWRISQALHVANYTESLNSKYSVSRTHEIQ